MAKSIIFNIFFGVLTGKFELYGNGRRLVFQSHRRCLLTVLQGDPIMSGRFHWVSFTRRTSGAVLLVSIRSPWRSVARHPLYLKAIFNSGSNQDVALEMFLESDSRLNID